MRVTATEIFDNPPLVDGNVQWALPSSTSADFIHVVELGLFM